MPEKAAGFLVLRLIQIQISLFSLSLNTLFLTSRQHYLHLLFFLELNTNTKLLQSQIKLSCGMDSFQGDYFFTSRHISWFIRLLFKVHVSI